MIVDGWFDWASERVPGPPEKHYGQQDEHKGVVCHSMAGSYDAALARLMGPDRASWKGSILLDGRLIQHYPMDIATWTSGAPLDNIAFDAFETEGARPMLFTDPQVATWARIIGELSRAYGWTPRRPVGPDDLTATCWEHNEMVRFGSDPTACPDGRADWPRMMQQEDDMAERVWCPDRAQTWIVGKGGAAPVVYPADDAIWKSLYGPHTRALSGAALDAMAPPA